jgi:plasmid replication initiation protein
MGLIEREKLVVTQANALARSAHSMTLFEKRLIMLVIARIRQVDEEFVTYRIPVTELVRALELTSNRVYEILDDLSDKLLSRVVKVETPGRSFEKFNWVHHFRYVSQKESETSEAYVEIRLHDHLRPLLLRLTKHFNSIPFGQLVALPSVNSIRMLEILFHDSHGLEITTLTYEVEDLKFRLGLEEKYQNFKDFRVNVIDRAQKDLAGSTSLAFTYMPVKSGRKVTHVAFKLKANPVVGQLSEKDPNALIVQELPADTGVTAEQLRVERELRDVGFALNPRSTIQTYDLDRVRKVLQQAKRAEARAARTRNPIQNLGGLVMFMLKQAPGEDVEPEMTLESGDLDAKQIKEIATSLLTALAAARREFVRETWMALDATTRDTVHDVIKLHANTFILRQLEKENWGGLLYEQELQKALERHQYLVFPPELDDVRFFATNSGQLDGYPQEQQELILQAAEAEPKP